MQPNELHPVDCENCGCMLTMSEQHENYDMCHKCFDAAFMNEECGIPYRGLNY